MHRAVPRRRGGDRSRETRGARVGNRRAGGTARRQGCRQEGARGSDRRAGEASPYCTIFACTGLLRDRKFYLFDTWEGLPSPAHEKDDGFSRGQYLRGVDLFWRNADHWRNYYNHQTASFADAMGWDEAVGHLSVNVGLFADTMPGALRGKKVVALFCDGDMYQISLDCLASAAPSLLQRSYIYHDDYFTFSGKFQAVRSWRKDNHDLGDIYLVPQDLFVLHPELSSPCKPPTGNRNGQGTCNGQK